MRHLNFSSVSNNWKTDSQSYSTSYLIKDNIPNLLVA